MTEIDLDALRAIARLGLSAYFAGVFDHPCDPFTHRREHYVRVHTYEGNGDTLQDLGYVRVDVACEWLAFIDEHWANLGRGQIVGNGKSIRETILRFSTMSNEVLVQADALRWLRNHQYARKRIISYG